MNYNELITRLLANAGSGRPAKDIALRDAATAINSLMAELEDERYRHDRLQDFEVAQAQELERVKADLEYAKLALMGKAIAEIKEFEGIPVDRLRELAKADKEKRLVVLPCKVGDTVYQVDCMTHSEALKSGVPQSRDPHQNRKYGRKRAEYLPLIVREKKMVKTLYREIGKTVFLTREEAEAALNRKDCEDG